MLLISTNSVVCGSNNWFTISSLSSVDFIEMRGAIEAEFNNLGNLLDQESPGLGLGLQHNHM